MKGLGSDVLANIIAGVLVGILAWIAPLLVLLPFVFFLYFRSFEWFKPMSKSSLSQNGKRGNLKRVVTGLVRPQCAGWPLTRMGYPSISAFRRTLAIISD